MSPPLKYLSVWLLLILFTGCNHYPVMDMAGALTVVKKSVEKIPGQEWEQLLPEFPGYHIKIERKTGNGERTRSSLKEGGRELLVEVLHLSDFGVIQKCYDTGSLISTECCGTRVKSIFYLIRYINDLKDQDEK